MVKEKDVVSEDQGQDAGNCGRFAHEEPWAHWVEVLEETDGSQRETSTVHR